MLRFATSIATTVLLGLAMSCPAEERAPMVDQNHTWRCDPRLGSPSTLGTTPAPLPMDFTSSEEDVPLFPVTPALPATAATAPSVPFPLAHRKSKFDWSSCADSMVQPDPLADQTLDRSSPIDIHSDHATVYEQASAVLWGHVRLTHPGEVLETPWLLYDLDLDTVQAQYGLRYRRGGLLIEGQEGFFDLEHNRGTMESTRYSLPLSHARGTATTAHMEDRTHSHYTDATYSTCAAGNEDWILRARTLDLDQSENVGVGHDVVTYFKGVPLFYTPYFSFPISNKRESGLLTPSVGTSSRSGLDLRIPYYWNIAPNYDATLTTRSLSRRGLQIDGEFRYLTARTSGQVELEYLPHDRLTDGHRSLFSMQQATDVNAAIHTDVLFNKVSDSNYFHDLGDTINLTSISYLERHANLTYLGNQWSGVARLEGFQTLDGSRPFERVPQFQFLFDPVNKLGGMEYKVAGEASHFERTTLAGDTASNLNYTGSRVWLQPYLSYPIVGLSGFFTPRLTIHHVDYALANVAPGLPSTPSLTVPMFSADAGLFLERHFTFGSRSLVQTLEPRIYYLYVPYQNQQNFPIFDTTLLDFDFGQLFRENRFSGPDRIGDANQIALAATSRFLDGNNGAQLLYGSLGQVIYFQNRQVTLGYGSNNAATATNDGGSTSRSDTMAEVGAHLGKHITASSTLEWSQQNGQPERRFIRLRYQSDHDHIVNLALDKRRDLMNQTDVSFVWPIAHQWRVVGRWNYSLKDSQTMESFLGVRYEKCCWAMQVIARRYVSLPNAAPANAVMIQFELKGLASIGEKSDPLLTNSILGYGSDIFGNTQP